MTPDFAAKVRKLWKEGCTCGGIDIGAAYLHEHGCGVPTPDDVASALSSAYAAGAESRQGEVDKLTALASDGALNAELRAAGIDPDAVAKRAAVNFESFISEHQALIAHRYVLLSERDAARAGVKSLEDAIDRAFVKITTVGGYNSNFRELIQIKEQIENKRSSTPRPPTSPDSRDELLREALVVLQAHTESAHAFGPHNRDVILHGGIEHSTDNAPSCDLCAIRAKLTTAISSPPPTGEGSACR